MNHWRRQYLPTLGQELGQATYQADALLARPIMVHGTDSNLSLQSMFWFTFLAHTRSAFIVKQPCCFESWCIFWYCVALINICNTCFWCHCICCSRGVRTSILRRRLLVVMLDLGCSFWSGTCLSWFLVMIWLSRHHLACSSAWSWQYDFNLLCWEYSQHTWQLPR